MCNKVCTTNIHTSDKQRCINENASAYGTKITKKIHVFAGAKTKYRSRIKKQQLCDDEASVFNENVYSYTYGVTILLV